MTDSSALKELAVCWGGDNIKVKSFKKSYRFLSAPQEKKQHRLRAVQQRDPTESGEGSTRQVCGELHT